MDALNGMVALVEREKEKRRRELVFLMQKLIDAGFGNNSLFVKVKLSEVGPYVEILGEKLTIGWDVLDNPRTSRDASKMFLDLCLRTHRTVTRKQEERLLGAVPTI